MRKVIAAVFVIALLAPASAVAQHVKTNGVQPNPIREYGKFSPTQHVKTFWRAGSGSFRVL